MQIKIDGKIYNCKKRETVLDVCRRNGINIPTLCFHNDLGPSDGICRLCLVKTNQQKGLVTSCQTSTNDLLEVITNDEEIEKARRINLELLWVDHAGKCFKCIRNGNCSLQDLARDFEIDVNDFIPNFKNFEKDEQLKILKESLKNRIVDDGNPSVFRDNQYCVECCRCIKTCRDLQTIGEYEMHNRSIQTSVGTACELPMDCIFCGQCANHCPTAAITEKDETDKLEQILGKKDILKVFQVVPAVGFALGEEFNLDAGNDVTDKISGALRKLGADFVFDMTFSADLVATQQAYEFAERVSLFLDGDESVKLPMFTGCCSSFVLYIEKYWPKFRGHLSGVKSAQQVMGAMIKIYFMKEKKINPESIKIISIVPCTSKKFEATRDEMNSFGTKDVDLVITTREFARYLKKRRINLLKLDDEEFDEIFNEHFETKTIFGTTGGVAETILRTAFDKLHFGELPRIKRSESKDFKGTEAVIKLPQNKQNTNLSEIKIAVVHGIRNARKIIESVEKGNCDYHFIEAWACPDGCLGGGGQPIFSDVETIEKRKKLSSENKENLLVRKAHENPAVKKAYKEFLRSPEKEKARKYFRAIYIDRSKNKR